MAPFVFSHIISFICVSRILAFNFMLMSVKIRRYRAIIIIFFYIRFTSCLLFIISTAVSTLLVIPVGPWCRGVSDSCRILQTSVVAFTHVLMFS